MRLRPGETEGRGWHVEELTDVVDSLFEACSPVAGRPRIIGIDGRGGAGKTELASRLQAIDVVWVEGIGVIREELASWLDASIWLQGDLDEQERRMVIRDGADPDHQRFHAMWVAEELPFLQQERPWAKATLVATNTVDIGHDPETQLIVGDPV